MPPRLRSLTRAWRKPDSSPGRPANEKPTLPLPAGSRNRGKRRLSLARRNATRCTIGQAGILWESPKWTTPLRGGTAAAHQGRVPKILARISERFETPNFSITVRRNALTVFGLMFIRCAISFVVRPPSRSSTVPRSLTVSPNFRAILVMSRDPDAPRSTRSTFKAPRDVGVADSRE